MIKKEIQPNEWKKIIIGIRRNSNFSQTKLSKEMGLSRQAISRYESLHRFPDDISKNKILNYLASKNLKLEEVIRVGDEYCHNYKKRIKKQKLDLLISEELAELIGIILGDGEIRPDGTIRVSFDPKKDVNFVQRRVIYLIKSILGNKVNFESEKRISFGNIAFMRYLNSIGLPSGSKFKNNVQIPKVLFRNNKLLCAVVRGLFDTDGYFGYLNGSVELMLGRFSKNSSNLVNSISSALKILNIKHKIIICNDKQYKVRLTDRLEIIKFMSIIGSSNLRHITRFLLWRISKYEAKIEIEGFNVLIRKIKESVDKDIETIKLPFFWNSNNQIFLKYINQDKKEIKGSLIRKDFSWSLILNDLMKIRGTRYIAKRFGIKDRSIRKWRQGTRTPSKKFILKILKILEENKMNIKKYKVIKNG